MILVDFYLKSENDLAGAAGEFFRGFSTFLTKKHVISLFPHRCHSHLIDVVLSSPPKSRSHFANAAMSPRSTAVQVFNGSTITELAGVLASGAGGVLVVCVCDCRIAT